MFSGRPTWPGLTPGMLEYAAQILHALQHQGRKLVAQGSYLAEEVGLAPKVTPPQGLPSAPYIHPHGHLVSGGAGVLTYATFYVKV